MITRKITLGTEELPFRWSFGAQKDFQNERKKHPLVYADYELEDYAYAIYQGLLWGWKAEKRSGEFDKTFEDVIDMIDTADMDWVSCFSMITNIDRKKLEATLEEERVEEQEGKPDPGVGGNGKGA